MIEPRSFINSIRLYLSLGRVCSTIPQDVLHAAVPVSTFAPPVRRADEVIFRAGARPPSSFSLARLGKALAQLVRHLSGSIRCKYRAIATALPRDSSPATSPGQAPPPESGNSHRVRLLPHISSSLRGSRLKPLLPLAFRWDDASSTRALPR